MKHTISARADGAVCSGREAVPIGVFLIKNNQNTLKKPKAKAGP